MRVIVLGSAAGGGVPQWNCACDNCRAARSGGGVAPRTQDSVAVSADGRSWFLLNASPDVLQQIAKTPALAPPSDGSGGSDATSRGRSRRSPIAGVVLTNGDLDHCLGLLSLREWTPFSLYATRETYRGLVDHNIMFRTLARQRPHVVFRPLSARGELHPLVDGAGRASGLRLRCHPVAGKVPLHLKGLVNASPEVNLALVVEQPDNGVRLVYAPSAGSAEGIGAILQGAHCMLFDGTFWSEDELSRVGGSGPTAREMAHLPVGGASGSLEQIAGSGVALRVFTHINNTNPMLRSGGPERALVESRGWMVAEDGMDLSL